MKKAKYRLMVIGDWVIGTRHDRNDGMAEMHVFNVKTKVHRWEIARFIGAMDLVNGKSGINWNTH